MTGTKAKLPMLMPMPMPTPTPTPTPMPLPMPLPIGDDLVTSPQLDRERHRMRNDACRGVDGPPGCVCWRYHVPVYSH